MENYCLDEAAKIGMIRSVLYTDALVREHAEFRGKTSAQKLSELPYDKAWPQITDIENGFVFDPLANNALYFYMAGKSDEVRCVGRWIDSGLAMPAEGFGV